jgi:hypothetical protein
VCRITYFHGNSDVIWLFTPYFNLAASAVKFTPGRGRVFDLSVMYEVQRTHNAYDACQILWLDVPRKEDPPAPASAYFSLTI